MDIETKKRVELVIKVQRVFFYLLTPIIFLLWIAKIISNFVLVGSDSGLEIISNIHSALYDSNGQTTDQSDKQPK